MNRLSIVVLLCVCCRLAPAPAPLERRTTAKFDMSGEWVLLYNESEWRVTMEAGEESGSYRSVGPLSGRWEGRWQKTEWSDVFMIVERPEGGSAQWFSFPVRYDGGEMKVLNSDSDRRGRSWRWSCDGSVVSIRRR